MWQVLPSVEYERAVAAEEAKRRAAQEALEAQMRAQAEAAAAAAAAEAAAAAQAVADAAERERERAARREAALASLPFEPSDGTGVAVQVRCPDGTRATRRLDPASPLLALFALVDGSDWQAAPSGDGYALAASYPRRVYRRAEAMDGRTLADAGLTGRQEALFVELIEEASSQEVAMEEVPPLQ